MLERFERFERFERLDSKVVLTAAGATTIRDMAYSWL